MLNTLIKIVGLFLALFFGLQHSVLAQKSSDTTKQNNAHIKIMVKDGDKTIEIDTVFKANEAIIQKSIASLHQKLEKMEGNHMGQMKKIKKHLKKIDGHDAAVKSFEFHFDSDTGAIFDTKNKEINVWVDSIKNIICIKGNIFDNDFLFDLDSDNMPFFHKFFKDDCPKMREEFFNFHDEEFPDSEEEVIIKGEDTIIIKKGGNRMIKRFERNHKPENFEYFVTKTKDNDSVKVMVKMDKDVRFTTDRNKRKAPSRLRWNQRSMTGLTATDLSPEDIDNLKGSDFKIKSSYQTLGISDLSIESIGRKSLRISFKTNETKNLEVKLFNEAGETIYHEVMKVFSGIYTKEMMVNNLKETYYLQIKQGKKALNKKIVPDR